jgi:hypothetical protein
MSVRSKSVRDPGRQCHSPARRNSDVTTAPVAITEDEVCSQRDALETGLSTQAYLQLLSDRSTAILGQGVPATYSVSLAVSLQLAFGELALDDLAALAPLRLTAQMAPKPIPSTVFTNGPNRLPPPLTDAASDPMVFAGITGLLRRRALARVGPTSLQVHRLVTCGYMPARIGPGDSSSCCG